MFLQKLRPTIYVLAIKVASGGLVRILLQCDTQTLLHVIVDKYFCFLFLMNEYFYLFMNIFINVNKILKKPNKQWKIYKTFIRRLPSLVASAQ